MKKALLKLYLSAPKVFKNKILKQIIKREGGQMYSETLRAIHLAEYGVSVGYGSYGGCFNSNNNIPFGVKFGRYCSIASNLRIFRANHPKGTFTTHPLLYNPIAGYVKKDMLVRPPLIIDHDVWIGEWVVILPGVHKIGNGAIIGAGSIVTKNVEPYSIVAGNPAKCIGFRFDNEVIESLEKSKWWEMNKDELIHHIDELNHLVNMRFV